MRLIKILDINIFLAIIVEHNQYGERDFTAKLVVITIYVKVKYIKYLACFDENLQKSPEDKMHPIDHVFNVL